MITSGTKKGIATSAVTALAIAGLPLLSGPASAVTHSSTLGAGEVDLVQPVATTVSAKPDGQNATQRLTAIGGTGVTGVRFEYQIGSGPWVLIGEQTSRNDDGTFAVEWNPTPIAGSSNVTLRATGLGTATPDQDSLGGVTVNNNADTVNVTAGSTLNVFQAPYTNGATAGQYAVVEGTSSAPGATPTLDFYDPSADAFAGRTAATTSTTPQGSPTGTWRGTLDITGYDYGGGTDEVLVKATNGTTDDAESFVINRQQLGTVTAEPTNANVPGTGTADITITVLDEDGDPIRGAEVRREGGAYVGQTDADGQVVAQQQGGTEAFYYANATDSDPFEAGLGDERSEDVTVGQFDPEPTSLEATSANGEAFDYDEYDADDIQVQVQDQEGNDVPFEQSALQTVDYTWTFRAFDGDPASRETEGTAVVGIDGSADIPLPQDRTEGGTYTLSASLRANPATGQGAVEEEEVLTVKAGQAEIDFTEDEAAAEAGGSATIAGSLELEDGTGLPGRPITLTYDADDTTGDAAFDQQSGNDAASRTVTTGENGGFSATLDDPAAGQGQTQGTETGAVTAETDDYDDPNTPVDQDNADASATQDVTFFNDAAPEGAEVAITGLQGTGKPGAPSYGTATVTDADGDPVPNVAVRLTVDGDSFFTNGPEDGTVGEEAGDLTELGQSITRVTNADGEVDFAVGIERSEEFDDDGRATDTVRTTVGGQGGASDTQDVAWSTADPLNGGEVVIDLAADEFQESGVLPQAPTTDDVAYDVKVTDQFGNPVGGEDVAITADGGDVVDDGDDPVDTVESDFDEDPEFELSSEEADDITPTGTWQANTSVYAADGADENDDADIVTTNDTEAVTGDGPTAEFYEVDFAASTYSLEQQGDEEREVGDTVIMVYSATDQNGEEIEFDVAFFRTGPGNDDDGSADERIATGEDGMASYVFSGNTEGRARVSAIGYVGNQVQPESQVTDTVDFGEVRGPGGGGPVEILLAADSNGPRKDIVRVQVDEAAAGETLRLFVIRGTKAKGNKRLIKIREDIVPEDGRLTFKKADRNGNRKTRFIAKIRTNGNVVKSNTQKPR